MLSVNQINAQAKLTEAWKITHLENHPLKWEKRTAIEGGRTTSLITTEKIIETGNSNLSLSTCKSDSIRAWNKAPEAIKNAKTIYCAKIEIKSLSKLFLCKTKYLINVISNKSAIKAHKFVNCRISTNLNKPLILI